MSLVATKIQDVRVKNPEFDKNEHRLSNYGAFDFFYEQSKSNPLLTQTMRDEAMRSAGKTIQTPVIDYDGDIAISHSRSCTIADAENTSKMVGVTWQTYAVGFTMVPSLYSNNEIDYTNDFAKKIKKCGRVMGAALDTAAIAALEANKTQVIADPLNYTVTGHSVQVPWAGREGILSDIEPMMESNDFYDGVHIVGNVGVRSLLNKLAEQGVYNSANKRLEYLGKEFHTTNRLVNGEGKFATFYAIEEGNVDMLFRVDRESARGASGAGHEWDVINMPYLGIPVGVHYYEAVGDQSAIASTASADMTCNIKEYYGFSVDVAFVVAYNSSLSTKANPIIKTEIAKE